jgi:glutamate N-acetyltransferase/amino-acid N-acetyltransferase
MQLTLSSEPFVNNSKVVPEVPQGFVFAATKCGLKASGGLDLALAEAPLGASAAAVFTKNLVAAAPVIIGKKHLARTQGQVRAVIVNAGNANCATGAHGFEAASEVCHAVAQSLSIAPQFVFPSSTGIIGVPLPTEKVLAALPTLIGGKSGTPDAVSKFAAAIMTTDTRPKIVTREIACGKKTARILGVAKGSGMIHPNLATMLAYIFTDIGACSAELKALLRTSCDASFNRITVDGDTSTNDTVLLMASGASGCTLKDRRNARLFAAALSEVCAQLAEMIVSDGEGVSHVVNLTVEGARTSTQADTIARTIAHSMLVKTAWAGADPNWGRLLAAAGRSGVPIKPAEVDIYIGDQLVCRGGQAAKFDPVKAHKLMSQAKYEVRLKVGRGKASVSIMTTDLTAEYVRINADYST